MVCILLMVVLLLWNNWVQGKVYGVINDFSF